MTQRGGFDFVDALFIEEGQFGTTPTTGVWLWTGVPTLVDPARRPTKVRRVGLGRQLPSDFQTVKQHWELRHEFDLVDKSVAAGLEYNWKDFLDMLLNVAAGVPQNQPNWFSFGSKADLTADEFYWLKGGAITRFEVGGSSVEEVIRGAVDAIFQSGDYGITDPVSGTATRKTKMVTELVSFGDIDIWYDTTTPTVADSMLSRLNSWALRMTRRMEMRGTKAAAPTLYREFVCVEQGYELELNIDFDSRTEYEHFIDDQDFYATLRIPDEAGGVSLALEGGSWLAGGLPARELDLMSVRLTGEFTKLTVSDIS